MKTLAPATSLSFLLAAGSISLAASPSSPIDVGDRRQVFIDRLFLAEAKGVKLRVHPPRKTGEANINTDRPWEAGGLGPYSSVLYVDGTYHMWYHAMDDKLWHTSPESGSICYATSRDGIRWEKPELGITEYKGSRKNNIVVGHGAAGMKLGQDGMMVFLDPNAPGDERFRMVNRFGGKEAVKVLSSGDGIHWRLTHDDVVTYRPEEKGHHLDSQNVMWWDDQLRKYVCYVRRNRKEPGSQGRTIARGESDRLGGFPLVQDMPVVLGPDEYDRDGDVNLIDYYSSAAIKYPWADRAYYLFPQAYYHYTNRLHEFSRQTPTNAGAMETQFAASRDGLHWERYDRRAFVPLGMNGEVDCYSTRILWGIVPDVSGREMYMYYRASDWLHGWDRDERNRKLLTEAGLGATQDATPISRLVLRRDGFVSVRAEYTSGEFTTPPLRFSGSRLVLNIDTSATGTARVELQDEKGTPIPGYALADCDWIHTSNQISRPVSWKGKAAVSELAGKPIRMRVVMKSTDLYAFQFTP